MFKEIKKFIQMFAYEDKLFILHNAGEKNSQLNIVIRHKKENTNKKEQFLHIEKELLHTRKCIGYKKQQYYQNLKFTNIAHREK